MQAVGNTFIITEMLVLPLRPYN